MDTLTRQAVAALLGGVCLALGLRIGDQLADPYSEPRLALEAWRQRYTPRGGEPA